MRRYREPRTDQIITQITEGGFLDDLKIASKTPAQKQNKFKNHTSLVELFCSKIKWSPSERRYTLYKHYGLYHAFGLPFIVDVISPGMRDSPPGFRMCLSIISLFDNDINNIWQVELPEKGKLVASVSRD